ncbi:MAG: hypothetical protein NT165_02235 [Candidatus Falkowbacteria bacterium]|nr:hypothetical protein [Candidatus Falkowbacteria bacterium]
MNIFFVKTVHAYDFGQDSGLNKVANKMGYPVSGAPFSPENAVATGITYVLSFLGIIFLIMAIYAGITWMSSEGNEKTVEKAKDILKNSIIGLIIVALAYAISYFILSIFSSYIK